MGDKKPKAYTFTKNAGPQFNLLPDEDGFYKNPNEVGHQIICIS
jgi:hypothetical protein